MSQAMPGTTLSRVGPNNARPASKQAAVLCFKKEFGMRSIKDILLLDTVLEVEPCSFLWKLLSGVLRPDFQAMKIPGSPTGPANFQLNVQIN